MAFPPTPDQGDFVLAILRTLELQGLNRIREYELHQAVRLVQTVIPGKFSFADEPISYSYDLYDALCELDRTGRLDELRFTHNGWVPHDEYRLTRLGRSEGEDARNGLALESTRSLQAVADILTDFRQSYAPMSISPYIHRRTLY